MTMAPMSATPSDEPSCWDVYCRPPASLRPEASTEDWTTLPSWDARRPMPTPSRAIERLNAGPSSSGSMPAMRTTMAAAPMTRPARMMVRTE